MEILILSLYTLCLVFIALYSLGQLHLIYLYFKNRRAKKSLPDLVLLDTSSTTQVPYVSIQLPIYNELYVVEGLIDAVCAFNYPKNRLEIQILDDSNDQTVQIIASKVAYYQARGVDIQHVRRRKREGFKAGALAHGLTICKGEFIAIFDADFLPRADFLRQTIPFFANPKIGLVQTRWEHLNENYSLLTRLQAMALDAHFSIEQMGRNMGHFMNFNGTAGVWRKTCIEDAGGWKSDTLTEDLDLSYRAQLKGWEFQYLNNIGTPAQLPITMNAFKSQQFRWVKGAAECARKNLRSVICSEQNLGTKIHAALHLLNTSVFIHVLVISFLALPVALVGNYYSEYYPVVVRISNLSGVSFILALFFYIAYRDKREISLGSSLCFIVKFSLFVCVSMGLALQNGIGVFEGYLGKKTPFVRTPKFNLVKQAENWKQNKYTSSKISPFLLLETLLLVYFIIGIIFGFYLEQLSSILFHSMLVIGYGIVCGYSYYHRLCRTSKS